MIGKCLKLVFACISLLSRNYEENGGFCGKGVLFRSEDLVGEANRLYARGNTNCDESDVRVATYSGVDADKYKKYFVTPQAATLSYLHRLANPDEVPRDDLWQKLDNAESGVETLAPAVFRDGTTAGVRSFLLAYFDYVKELVFPDQRKNNELTSRECIWISAAALAYNEYARVQNCTEDSFAFSQAYIAKVAGFLSPSSGQTYDAYAHRMAVKGRNRQDYSYLIPTGPDGAYRRVSASFEGGVTRPSTEELHLDFEVVTLDGPKSVNDLVEFVDGPYGHILQALPAKPATSPSGRRSSVPPRPEPPRVNTEELDSVGGDARPEGEGLKEKSYSRDDFLSDVFIGPEEYDRLIRILERKKNLIIQGAPGTGKTFAAKRLAWSILGEEDESAICCVQFHQSTCYEDIVIGFRPDEDGGFLLKQGVFVEFCEQARSMPDKPHFFIIDEINRGNVSKIFGELLMLIEADHRDEEVLLPLSGETFSVPGNVRIIGMMNTADRGLALIDYALRRRFAFFEMKPAFGRPSFERMIHERGSEELERLVSAVSAVNRAIEEDSSLGKGFRIGHSFFCFPNDHAVSHEELADIVELELLPLLEEYWFDDADMLEKQRKLLAGAVDLVYA